MPPEVVQKLPNATTLNFESYKQKVSFKNAFAMMFSARTTILARTLLGFIVCTAVFIICGVFTLLFTGNATDIVGLLLFLFVVIVLPGVIAAGYLSLAYHKAQWRIRLSDFAYDNNFLTLDSHSSVGYPGAIFDLGYAGRFESSVIGFYKGIAFEFGNYYYEQRPKENSFGKLRGFGVVVVRLYKRLPHVLFDSKKNNRLVFSNLPHFSGTQRFELEGDFDKHFKVYVPLNYERDTLYFVTPELMAEFIDYSSEFDIEVVDDYMFIYSNKPFSLDLQPVVEKIFRIIDIVGGEMLENGKRYTDYRVGDPHAGVVAWEGRRLKRPFIFKIATLVPFMVVWGIIALYMFYFAS